MSKASDAARHRCTNPRCDAGPGGKPARCYGRFNRCRVCRSIDAVKRNEYNARKRAISDVDSDKRIAVSA